MIKRAIRIGVLVLPWLMAVALSIGLFPGFVDSNIGTVDPIHLLGFEFVMIPLAPLMMLRQLATYCNMSRRKAPKRIK